MPGPWDVNQYLINNATITANTNHTGIRFEEGAELRAELAVEGAVSGTTPTLDVKLQDSADGSTYADINVAFTQQTATGGRVTRYWKVLAGRPWVRAVSTVGGTAPSFAGTYVRVGHWSGRPTTPAAT